MWRTDGGQCKQQFKPVQATVEATVSAATDQDDGTDGCGGCAHKYVAYMKKERLMVTVGLASLKTRTPSVAIKNENHSPTDAKAIG